MFFEPPSSVPLDDPRLMVPGPYQNGGLLAWADDLLLDGTEEPLYLGNLEGLHHFDVSHQSKDFSAPGPDPRPHFVVPAPAYGAPAYPEAYYMEVPEMRGPQDVAQRQQEEDTSVEAWQGGHKSATTEGKKRWTSSAMSNDKLRQLKKQDPRKASVIISKRESAKRSRLRQDAHIAELELELKKLGYEPVGWRLRDVKKAPASPYVVNDAGEPTTRQERNRVSAAQTRQRKLDYVRNLEAELLRRRAEAGAGDVSSPSNTNSQPAAPAAWTTSDGESNLVNYHMVPGNDSAGSVDVPSFSDVSVVPTTTGFNFAPAAYYPVW